MVAEGGRDAALNILERTIDSLGARNKTMSRDQDAVRESQASRSQLCHACSIPFNIVRECSLARRPDKYAVYEVLVTSEN